MKSSAYVNRYLIQLSFDIHISIPTSMAITILLTCDSRCLLLKEGSQLLHLKTSVNIRPIGFKAKMKS